MNEIILKIATLLQVTPMDVHILAVGFVLFVVFLAIGIQKTYEVFFGLVVGLAIYLMLTVLLAPQYQTADTVKFFSPGVSNFLVGSSVYLIFILMILTPISGGIKIPYPKNLILRIASHFLLAIALLVFMTALVMGFASKTYIFGIDTGFTLLGKTDLYHSLQATKIMGWIGRHIQPIVLFGVFFMLYKLLFAEMVATLMVALIAWLKSLKDKNASSNAHEDHGHETSHDEHGMADFDLDLGHDDHGHDDHSHGSHH